MCVCGQKGDGTAWDEESLDAKWRLHKKSVPRSVG